MSSPISSQLLFGEYASVEVEQGSWLKVCCLHDNHIGWVHKDQVGRTDIVHPNHYLNFEIFYGVLNDQGVYLIPFGARLVQFDGLSFRLLGKVYTFSGAFVEPEKIGLTTGTFMKIVTNLVNTPYLKGGRTPAGIDAPALNQLVFSFFGIALYRTIRKQVEQGLVIHFFKDIRIGDVMFFGNTNGNLVHTGIYIGDGKIVHSHGKVQISQVNNTGILSDVPSKYLYKLRIIKRYIYLEEEQVVKKEAEPIAIPSQPTLF